MGEVKFYEIIERIKDYVWEKSDTSLMAHKDSVDFTYEFKEGMCNVTMHVGIYQDKTTITFEELSSLIF